MSVFQFSLVLILLIPSIAYADLNNGLVGWWQLDDGSGTTAVDSSGRGNTGTLVNGPAAWTTGKIRGALDFTAAGGHYVSVGHNNFSNLEGNQTIAAWAFYTATPAGNQNLYSNYSGGSAATQLGFRSGIALVWKFGGVTVVTSSITPSSNAWHHYVYTYDGTNNNFYIDGTLIGTSVTATNSGAITINRIATTDGPSEFFNGKIDDVRVYSRTLTATEVNDLYLIGLQRNQISGGGAIIKDIATKN